MPSKFGRTDLDEPGRPLTPQEFEAGLYAGAPGPMHLKTAAWTDIPREDPPTAGDPLRLAGGLLETLATLGSGTGASAWAGLGALSGVDDNMDDAANRIRRFQEEHTYAPRSREGKALVKAMGLLTSEYPGRLGEAVAGGDSPLGRTIGENAIPVVMTLLGLRSVMVNSTSGGIGRATGPMGKQRGMVSGPLGMTKEELVRSQAAQAMEDAGKGKMAIVKATGMWRDPKEPGSWKVEFSDKNMKIDKPKIIYREDLNYVPGWLNWPEKMTMDAVKQTRAWGRLNRPIYVNKRFAVRNAEDLALKTMDQVKGDPNLAIEALKQIPTKTARNAEKIVKVNEKLAFKPTNVSWLKDVVDHPELFERYPFLKDVSVVWDRNVEGVAEYSPGTRSMRINPARINFSSNKKLLGESILHEVQHAIQGKEGWKGAGTNLDAAGGSWWKYGQNRGEQEARTTESRWGMTDEQRSNFPFLAEQTLEQGRIRALTKDMTPEQKKSFTDLYPTEAARQEWIKRWSQGEFHNKDVPYKVIGSSSSPMEVGKVQSVGPTDLKSKLIEKRQRVGDAAQQAMEEASHYDANFRGNPEFDPQSVSLWNTAMKLLKEEREIMKRNPHISIDEWMGSTEYLPKGDIFPRVIEKDGVPLTGPKK